MSSAAWSLDHCSLTVPNLDEAVAFFTSVAGASVAHRRSAIPGADPELMRTNFNAHKDAGFALAKLNVGQVGVEVFEYTAPDQRRDLPRNCDIGGSHLGFLVDDIAKAILRARAHPGVQILGEVQTLPDDHPMAGRQWVYLLTPWHQQLELVSDENRCGRTLRRRSRPCATA